MEDAPEAITCIIPRVKAADLQLQAQVSDAWQVASEKLTLSLCRHNVCVLEQSVADQTTLVSAILKTASLLSLEHPNADSLASSEEEPGLVLRPGRHSFNYKAGSSKLDFLTSEQSQSLEKVDPSCTELALNSIWLVPLERLQHSQCCGATRAGIQPFGSAGSGLHSSSVPLLSCALAC